MNEIGEQTQHSLDLVREHGITPPSCPRCGQADWRNWGAPTVDGTTQATDDGAVIWQCRSCGAYASLSANEIVESTTTS